MPGIAYLRGVRWVDGRGYRVVCERERALRDIEFGQRGTARQLLDRTAIHIARRKIHRRKITRSAESRINQAHAFNQLSPVQIRNQAHTGDDITHRDIRSTLPLLCVLHDGVDRNALLLERVFQPTECGRGSRILIAQTLDQLCGKTFGQGFGFTAIVERIERRSLSPRHEQFVGQRVRFGARGTAQGELIG